MFSWNCYRPNNEPFSPKCPLTYNIRCFEWYVIRPSLCYMIRSAGGRKGPPKKEQSWKRPKMPKWRCLIRSMWTHRRGSSTTACRNPPGPGSGTHPSRYETNRNSQEDDALGHMLFQTSSLTTSQKGTYIQDSRFKDSKAESYSRLMENGNILSIRLLLQCSLQYIQDIKGRKDKDSVLSTAHCNTL